MKDLIIITAYCPDDNREDKLRKLVNSIENFKNNFEVMIVSHTPIPLDIQKKVDFVIFDKKNEILTEPDLLNQPWFTPEGNRRIQSSFLSKKNTHLAIWRLMIIGFNNAKNLGFSKVHHIEYDCEINEISEFIENSNLLNENNSVIYMDRQEKIAEVMFGSFQSLFIPKINPMLINLNEEKIKDLIREADSKSPEGLLLKLIQDSDKVIVKDRNILEKKGNKFGTINSQSINKNPWSVPYYDRLTNNIEFICWNTTNKEGIEIKIILNNNKLIHIPKVNFEHWNMVYLGKLEEINSIIVLENDFIRDTFYMKNDTDKEIFKKMSFKTID